MKERRPLEVVLGARSALDPRDQFGDVLDVGDHGVDGTEIALVADHLGAALQPRFVLACPGNRVEFRAGAADDGGACTEQFVRGTDANSPTGAGDDGDLAAEGARRGHPPNHRRVSQV